MNENPIAENERNLSDRNSAVIIISAIIAGVLIISVIYFVFLKKDDHVEPVVVEEVKVYLESGKVYVNPKSYVTYDQEWSNRNSNKCVVIRVKQSVWPGFPIGAIFPSDDGSTKIFDAGDPNIEQLIDQECASICPTTCARQEIVLANDPFIEGALEQNRTSPAPTATPTGSK